jgi:oligopeptide/dipeptide ABC transporter ATP-binding protein
MQREMMTNNNDAFLSVRDLVVEYTAEGRVIHAVNGVSFDLERGKTLGLVGETGSGKSTIPKAIMRILPDPPAKIRGGEIYLDGVSLLELAEKEMRKIRGRRISMIFQDPMTALNPIMKIGEQVAEVIKLHNDISWRGAKKRAVRMLETVGIRGDRFNEYPYQFSGGMAQRVVIAMALACSPELLIADEPTSALDVTIQAQVLDMITRLKTEYNTSMIMISHNLGVVAEQCDDLAVIYAGEVVELGSREAIFDHPTHPYTLGLLAAVPTLEDDRERLNRIPGLPPDPTDLPTGCHFGPRCPFANEQCSLEKSALIEVEAGHFCRCTRDFRLEARWPL